MAWDILQGDSLQLAAGLPDNSLDAIIQDPPAGVSFLGQSWDSDKGGRDAWIDWLASIMKEGFRALKPGGLAVCWALPRTSHWTAMALEKAGFEVKHVVSHLRSTGFPKGLDIAKACDRMRDDDIYHVTAFIAAARDKAGKTNPEIDEHFGYHGMVGHWTSSKSQPAVPTWENWLKLKELLGFDDSLDAEVQKLNGRKGKPGDAWYERPILGYETDGVQGHIFSAAAAAPTYKSEFAVTGHVSEEAHTWDGWNTALRPNSEHWIVCQKPLGGRNYASNILQYGVGALNVKGCGVPRGNGEEFGWPSNIVVSHDPCCTVETCVEGCPALELDRQSGFSEWRRNEAPSAAPGGNTEGWGTFQTNRGARGHNDAGGASRYYNQFHFGPEDLPSFVYIPGATRAEKEAGCAEAGIEPKVLNRVNSGGLENDPRWEPKLVYNDHPTTKSVKLMRWLCRLVAPRGATILDMFAGSGTTGVAAVLEGMNFIGFDMDERYCQIARARIAHWARQETGDPGMRFYNPPRSVPTVAAASKGRLEGQLKLIDDE